MGRPILKARMLGANLSVDSADLHIPLVGNHKFQTVTATMSNHNTVSLISPFTTFFSLPIELRNIVYSLILIPSHNIKICSPLGKYLWGRKGRRWLFSMRICTLMNRRDWVVEGSTCAYQAFAVRGTAF